MKAISLWNPWAFLMAVGAKKNETRSWGTGYRGPLAIHAAKKWNSELLEMCRQEPFVSTLSMERPNQGGSFFFDDMLENILHFGCIVAVVDLYDCQEIRFHNRPHGNELYFGDYTEGRFMWMTQNVRRIANPIPFKGKQGFFDIPDALIEKAGEQ